MTKVTFSLFSVKLDILFTRAPYYLHEPEQEVIAPIQVLTKDVTVNPLLSCLIF